MTRFARLTTSGGLYLDRSINTVGVRSAAVLPKRCICLHRQHSGRWTLRKRFSAGLLSFITIAFMDTFNIAGRTFRSRLIVGTGKYKSGPETARALEASGAEMVTVAVRRVNLDRTRESLLDFIDTEKYVLLPNTAGCYTADEAIRTARLGREVGLSDWVKLEVIGDEKTLYPDVQATLEATRVLVREGFTVLPYTSDDVVFAKRLLDA